MMRIMAELRQMAVSLLLGAVLYYVLGELVWWTMS